MNLSAANGLVYASQIIFLDTTTAGGTTTHDSYYNIQSYASSSDQLELDPGGTTAVVHEVTSGTTTTTQATFAAPIVENTSGANTFTIGSGAGTVVIAGAATATTVTVSSGNLDVEGALTVSSAMTISGNAVLQGTNASATITLASGSLLNYDSSVSSEFDGQITGAGGLNVDAGANATFTIGGSNSYSGPTYIGGGTAKLANTYALPIGTALSMTGTAELDLNGESPGSLNTTALT